MKKILLLIILSYSISLFAQKPSGNPKMNMNIGRLYGKIIETNTKQTLPYASVTVYKMLGKGRDSLIGGGLTLENGDFNISNLPMGPLKLKVNFVGYKDITKMVKISPPNDIEQDLGDLRMEEDTKILGTAEIKADKVSTQLSLEKRVFNVDKNITATGGTAEDVLKNVPSVTVDMDGNAKLRDRGTTIYVDGKPTLMTLTQIPADQIESVEVISNPSAKYEASTTGGILNIVMKKNIKLGYNGVLSLGAGTQKRFNGMANLNVREGKWAIGAFLSGNSADVTTNGYVRRTNFVENQKVASYFDQSSLVNFQNNMKIGRLNVDYALNNRNTLSLAGTVSAGEFNINLDQGYVFADAARTKTSFGKRTTSPRNNFNFYNVESSWKKMYSKKDKSLVALANYGWGNGSNAAAWNTTGFDNNGAVLPKYPELVNIGGQNKNSQAVFQLDYTNPINDSTKIEMGVRSFWTQRDQQYLFSPFDYDVNAYEQDNQFSQNTFITENINAIYFTYSGQLKHKIQYQAGLRFEQSNLDGQTRLNNTMDFGYFYPKGKGKDLLRSFFPALYLSKKINAGTEIGLNFSRKIQRPNQRQIMPGITANDKQNIQIGNPNLQPEFVNLAELNYNKIFGKNNWLSTIYAANETNTLKPLSRPSANDPTLIVTTFVNGQNEFKYGFDNTLKLALGKNFDVMLNANVFNFKVSVDTFVNKGWTGNGKINLTYKLPADFSVQLLTAYEGNRPQPQGDRKGIFYGDFAVKKSFFKNVANVTFSINDILNSRKDITTTNLVSLTQEAMRRRDARYYKLTLQFPFGKADASMFKRIKDSKRQAPQEMPDFGG